jgi:glycosyltransferase involved in cell wall biosynthesis
MSPNSERVRPLVLSTSELETTFIECSVVIPCLNEVETLAGCIVKAQRALELNGIVGEVIVADNGSTDGSHELAARHNARVVHVASRGYGNALMAGIAAARGRFIIMGDADDSYDFGEIPAFLDQLRAGYELVQGCRLTSGGGTVAPGAMPFLHRWWGNPMFSRLARSWFRAPVHDIHCGMRGFTSQLYSRLDQRCTGMEFASEMVIKAALAGARITEVPITLYADRRTAHPPHLRTFRDGWRHLRFFLLFSPRWLFLVPGLGLVLSGLLGYAVAMPRLTIHRITFDVHTLLVASVAVICGYQSVLFAAMTKIFGISVGLLPADARITRVFDVINLERGLLGGAIAIAGGMVMLAVAVNQWRLAGFGNLDYEHTMRWVIPSMLLMVVGFQTILSSFFFSILGLNRR